ncbi:MAG TPA: hypothetical protein P5217_03650 [Methanoregulaceae archaeon]|nr:hypothetical protein [Methanoregulaceae archaeon]
MVRKPRPSVCIGHGLRLSAIVGKTITFWLEKKDLPGNGAGYGNRMEEIFVTCEELKQKYGVRFSDNPAGQSACIRAPGNSGSGSSRLWPTAGTSLVHRSYVATS